jgi:hypothetical protein
MWIFGVVALSFFASTLLLRWIQAFIRWSFAPPSAA